MPSSFQICLDVPDQEAQTAGIDRVRPGPSSSTSQTDFSWQTETKQFQRTDGSSSASAFNACSRRYRAAVDEHDEAEEALSSAKADNERLKEEIVRKTEAKDKLLAKIEATKEAARQMQSAIAKKSDELNAKS